MDKQIALDTLREYLDTTHKVLRYEKPFVVEHEGQIYFGTYTKGRTRADCFDPAPTYAEVATRLRALIDPANKFTHVERTAEMPKWLEVALAQEEALEMRLARAKQANSMTHEQICALYEVVKTQLRDILNGKQE